MRTLDFTGRQDSQGVALLASDDVKYASLRRVPLTTLHQPFEHIGAAAVRATDRAHRNPDLPARDIPVQSRLVVRESAECD